MIRTLFSSLLIAGSLAAPALAAVPLTYATAAAGSLKATFRFSAAQDAKLTCSMHPGVTSGKPGNCPTCKMRLVKQTHAIGVGLEGTNAKQVPADALVRLQVADAGGMVQTLPAGLAKGQFHLLPGKHTVTATVTSKSAKQVIFTVPYEVK